MAYCLNTDVASEFKKITFSSTSAVTDTEIDAFIVQADAEIDSQIGRKYQVPITGVESLKIIKQISIKLVADRVKQILQVKSVTEETSQEVQGGDLRSIAQEMIDKIVKGTLLLSDATLAVSHDGFKSFAVDEDLDYEFDITGDNW